MAVAAFVDSLPAATTRAGYAETLQHVIHAAGPATAVGALNPTTTPR